MARLALILAGALVIRVLYTLLVAQDIPVIGDALTYHLLGGNIADGKGFERAPHPQLAPFEGWKPGVPTAEHPPLFPLLIGLITKLGATGYLAQKLLLCVVGTVTVALVGPCGPRGGGAHHRPRGRGLAALYPFLWVVDGSLMSETLYGALLAATLWLALRFCAPAVARARGRRWGRWWPWRRSRAARRSCSLRCCWCRLRCGPGRRGARASRAAAALGAFAWCSRRGRSATSRRSTSLCSMSTNGNAVFVGSNCDAVYHGEFIGLWNFNCYGKAPGGDESERRPTASAGSTTRATMPGVCRS